MLLFAKPQATATTAQSKDSFDFCVHQHSSGAAWLVTHCRWTGPCCRENWTWGPSKQPWLQWETPLKRPGWTTGQTSQSNTCKRRGTPSLWCPRRLDNKDQHSRFNIFQQSTKYIQLKKWNLRWLAKKNKQIRHQLWKMKDSEQTNNKGWLTDSLSWFEDDVTAVEHQQADEDEYYDAESKTGLKRQNTTPDVQFSLSVPSARTNVRRHSNCNSDKKQQFKTIQAPLQNKSQICRIHQSPVLFPTVCWVWTCPSWCSKWQNYNRRVSRANIRRGRSVGGSWTEDETMHRTHMVMMLGFLEALSLPVTLKAVPRGLYT